MLSPRRATVVVRITAAEPPELLHQAPEDLGLAILVLPHVPELVDERGQIDILASSGLLEPDHVVAGPGGAAAEHDPAALYPDLAKINGPAVEASGSFKKILETGNLYHHSPPHS
jgi:hypothetical protein